MKIRREARLFLLGTLTMLSACNCGSGPFNKVLPTLQMADDSLDFGEVAVNSTSAPQTITLKAITTAAVTLSFAIQDDEDGVFAIDGTAPKSIPPNGHVTVSIVFSPKAVQPYAGTLVVTSNDPNPARTVHRIPLSGTGDSPQIQVMPDNLTFTAVACPAGADSIRCRDQQTATIKNVGHVNLTLGVVKIVGADASNAAPANLTLKNLVSTAAILPGDSLPVTILWKPHGDADVSQSQTGDFAARLEIPSDDPANPVIYVSLAAHADPAAAPHLCLNALNVTQRQYRSSQTGHPQVVTASVPTGQWADAAQLDAVHGVLPGMTVTFTTLPFTESGGFRMVDTVAQQSTPCTYDPQDLPLTTTWTVDAKPALSRTGITPANDSSVDSADGVLPIDAAGHYVVTVRVVDTLGLSASASMTLDAPLHDDLLAELTWPETEHPPVDLDLHLIVDSGAGVPSDGTLLSNQDCYWQSPIGQWFTDPAADLMPTLLLDDTGVSGRTESINLLTAPIGSRFRAVVHYFSGSDPITPQLEFLHAAMDTNMLSPVGTPITSSRPLQENDLWIGARIEFINCPADCATGMCCPPTVTTLNQYCTIQPDSAAPFSGQVTCPGGQTL